MVFYGRMKVIMIEELEVMRVRYMVDVLPGILI